MARPSISGVIKIGPQTGTVGQPLTYTLTVKNNGRTTAPGVKVVDTLPEGVVFVSASSTQGTCSYAAGRVTCQIGTMAGGATVTVTIVVKPGSAGVIYNLATVSARARDTNDKNDSSGVQTTISNPPLFTNIKALAYQALEIGPIITLPNQDLSIFGIEVTQGIQCFDTSKGLASCPNNSLSLVSKKDSAARIYLKYTGSSTSMRQCPCAAAHHRCRGRRGDRERDRQGAAQHRPEQYQQQRQRLLLCELQRLAID